MKYKSQEERVCVWIGEEENSKIEWMLTEYSWKEKGPKTKRQLLDQIINKAYARHKKN